MPDTRVLTATFAIVTSLFLSGARQDKAEIRATSLRGALRFWWRALAWAEVDGTAPVNDGARLARLGRVRRLETLLFGHAGSRRDSRQAALSIVVDPRKTELKGVRGGEVLLAGHKGKTTVGPSARYLGYGLIGAFGATEGKLSRPCIAAGQGFQARFRLTVPGDLEKKRLYPGGL
ncbi:CRISPR type III-B/RAMP module RAMP protein Cmr1 [Nitrospirillum amazonense]|uniref:CRISPR type III-B/RAMP module RAMP protein Cmr1 n=1 Tax=Nitrospirillum amazonense TaxID=28077 RepID=A0A560EL56_9PROT|nr:type III-B CRISPR module RAMP protein Cmr1 [Nitrospirillum amazonense]TWB10074.1 CRISPR type III-B/RAMP module RAMP protein Cmr1 [Nitrospirillum amazonense]